MSFISEVDLFAVRVSFLAPDASATLQRRGRRGGLVSDGRQPLASLPDNTDTAAAAAAAQGISKSEAKALVSKHDELCIKNEELCIKHEESCIKNEGICRRKLGRG